MLINLIRLELSYIGIIYIDVAVDVVSESITAAVNIDSEEKNET